MDIQNDINLEMWDRSFSEDCFERREWSWSLSVVTCAVSQTAGEGMKLSQLGSRKD
jgi:hypothetical protein